MNEKKRLYWQFAGSLCLLAFVFLGYVIKFYPFQHWLNTFDTVLIHWIQTPMNAMKTTLFKGFTFLANPATVIVLGAVILLLFLIKHRRPEAIWLAINTVFIAGVGNFLLKLAFTRPRPSHHLVTATGYSFPSGHADGSVLLYGTLLLIALTFIKNRATKIIVTCCAIVLILCIGMSRVYLGVHYPSDIIGGWLVGSAWLCFTYPIYRHRRFILDFKGGRS